MAFLFGKSHGQRSLAGYNPLGPKRVRHNLATKQQIFSVDFVAGTVVCTGMVLSHLTFTRKAMAFPVEEQHKASTIINSIKQRIKWTIRRSNQSTLKEISPEYSLEGLMLKLKLQ